MIRELEIILSFEDPELLTLENELIKQMKMLNKRAAFPPLCFLNRHTIDDKEEQKEALFEAWKEIFKQNREYSEKALDEILSKYERRCGKQCLDDINLEEVKAVLNLRKKSVAGPDSIPFAFLNKNHKALAPLF